MNELSKAFDYIDHNFPIAELNGYGFEKQSINFIYSYLTERKKEQKLTLRSVMGNVIFRCTSRLRLGPIFLNLYICDMFFQALASMNFAGYADDNTLYTYSSNKENVLDNLQIALEKFFYWFSTNDLVANAKKYQILKSSKAPVDKDISNTKILNEDKFKLFGVNLEGRLILIFT